MAERLSEEAKRMCRQCSNRSEYDASCSVLNLRIARQNKSAEDGECTSARITGLINPELEKSGEMFGRMRRLENKDWIFEGGSYPFTASESSPLNES